MLPIPVHMSGAELEAAVVTALTSTVLDAVAVLGVLVWVVALVVLVVGDASRAAHHVHLHPRDPSRRIRARQHHHGRVRR